MGTYLTCYPGVYTERERKALAEFAATSRAIAERGPVDVSRLISGGYPEGTPGIPKCAHVSEALVRYYNEKYLPDQKLYNDDAYAKAAGYRGMLALPTLVAYEHLLQIAVPPAARDEFIASNLWRKVTNVAPICVGDTIWFVVDYLNFKDLTPASGSIYRTISVACGGSMYNQSGQLVSRMDMKWYENLRTYAGDAPEIASPFVLVDWQTRPDHYYTDDDWAKMQSIWANEYDRGAEVLYWDDVAVGDEPAWTLDGPFDDTPNPTEPWGPGCGGSRSLRHEYTDPEIFKTMIRNPVDGIYRLPSRRASFPDIPDELGTVFSTGSGFGEWSFAASDDPASPPPPRAILINFFGRDVALRHIMNYIGEHGKLLDISWGIMNCPMFAAKGYDFPEDPDIPRFLDVLPDKRGIIQTHGLERDAMIVKSRVFEKGVECGQHYVRLAWWIETIDGQIFESGHATVALPAKE